MIIFDLSALSDDSHRRHLIKNPNLRCDSDYRDCICLKCERTNTWHPDYEAYNDAIDGDKPIIPSMRIFHDCISNRAFVEIQIWSDRCESVRVKTENWLMKKGIQPLLLTKMRPIGDDSPQEELFEKWLNELCDSESGKYIKKIDPSTHGIEMVFSSHAPTISMFRRLGVFVFDCNQGS